MREFSHPDQLLPLVGSELAVSDWFAMPQSRIDAFAGATDDHQWIHVDPARCERESPFGAPVAHGFLTLSLLPAMIDSCLRIGGTRYLVNYGLNKVRFPAAVPVDSRVRGRLRLDAVEPVEGGVQLVLCVTVEREGAIKPVCVAEFLIRCYD